jgi:hypothetical protein
MAILNPTTITVDAILTTKGRELLARNDGSFRITQFSLADDEIDYTLYNPTHPSGSAFYGEAIENTPVLEAFPNDSQIMRYKLVTLPRGTSKLPVIGIGGDSTITLRQGESKTITPQTLNYLGATSTFEANGYVVTIADSRLVSTFTGTGITTTTPIQGLNTTTGTVLSVTQVGTSFTLTATTVPTLFGTNLTRLSTTITVLGRDSGARITIPLNITKNPAISTGPRVRGV